MKIYFALFVLLLNSAVSQGAFDSSKHQYSLPKKAQLFLDKHFGQYEVDKLKYDTKNGECNVQYKNSINVKFDEEGNWEEVKSEFAPLPKSVIDLLPAPAIHFLAKKYPNKPILKIGCDSTGYKIELADFIDLEFDSKGDIIKIGEDSKDN